MNSIDKSFDKTGKAMLLSFLAFEMLIGKGHFKEVKTKKLHEEEDGKKRRKDPSNIRKNIKKPQIVSFHNSGQR